MKLRTLLPLAILVGLPACANDQDVADDDGAAIDNAAALVGTHVYRRPAKPTRSYPAPSSNVLWVATSGSDVSGNGSSAAPYQTIGKAVAVANAKPAGPTWTVVVKAGTYREGGIVITRSNVTIQRDGSAAVSIWGTVPLTGFAGAGPYTTTITSFDPTPLEANCADDHLNKGAKHYGAEQAFSVIRAGIPLQRVATAPGPGQYAYDNATNKLTLKDSPTEIEVVKQLWAFQTRASNVRLSGLDIEGYGTCAVDYRKTVNGINYYNAAVQFFKDTGSESGNVLEGSTIANNAGNGFTAAQSYGVTMDGNVLVNNGWDGAIASDANRLVVKNNTFGYNNFRHWGNSVEAGMKGSQIIDGVVWGNVFEHNAANGYWCDQGCGSSDLSKNHFVIAQNVFRNNDGKGLFYEVSHHAMIASNLVHDNGAAGIAAYGSRAVQIWNNTLVDNDASSTSYLANLSIVEDVRCAQGDVLPGGKVCTSGTAGVTPLPRTQYDNCAPRTDGPLANTCNSESIVVVNNIVSGSAGPRPLVNVTVPARTFDGSVVVTRSEYQAFFRPSASAPTGLIEWQKDAAGNPVSYATLAAFRSAVPGRETSSVEHVGGANPYFVDYASKNFAQRTSNTEIWGNGQTLPVEALKAIYWPSTSPAQPSKRIGAIAWPGQSSGTTPPPATTCDLAAPVYHVVQPSTGAELFTLSASEAADAKSLHGYTEDRGVAFDAAASSTAQRVAVYRVYNPTSKDRLYTTSTSEKASAAATYGYTTDEGVAFYAASGATSPCLAPVHRLRSGGIHTYSVSAAEVASLTGAGWSDEGVVYHAGTP
ncbi:MAG: metallophosphoesterase [Labilithrix sp.]|nr:metallophosphoesterase [Labilithrix sp.]